MRVPVNLASQPFRRDRPVIVASATAAIALAGMLAVLVSLVLSENARLKDSRADIAALESRVRALTEEQSKLDAVLRKPENAEVLERSLFLNSLLYRKGISWTKIFADLEKTVPHNVRIISIRPAVNAQNQITLEMNVGAESQEPVLQMLMALESSELFGSTYVHGMLAPSQTDPLFRYRVSVNYAQNL